MLINQSLIKDLAKYKDGELCGLIFENKWILKQYGAGTKSNLLGHFFEYLCTGALAKGEDEPPKPLKNKNGELSSDFKTAKIQAEYFHELISKFNIELLTAGEKVIADDLWVGTLDIRARWESLFAMGNQFYLDPENKDKNVIIDLKYSGLLDDKWSEFGWETNILPTKKNTMLQAKHYKFLFWKKYGYNPPFFFFVFDSKDEGRAKLIHVDIETWELEEFEKYLFKVKLYLDAQIKIGFKPIPDYEVCRKCDYKNWCSFKENFPKIINIKPK